MKSARRTGHHALEHARRGEGVGGEVGREGELLSIGGVVASVSGLENTNPSVGECCELVVLGTYSGECNGGEAEDGEEGLELHVDELVREDVR